MGDAVLQAYLWPALAGLLGWLAGAGSVHVAEGALAKRRLRSPQCPYCGQPLTLIQWSSLLSLLACEGHCRQCGRFLRVPRLVGEAFLMAVWVLIVAKAGLQLRTLLAMVTLIPQAMIMVTDLEAKLVPNRITLPALGSMLLLGTIVGPAMPTLSGWAWWQSLAGAATGFVIFRVLVWIGVAAFGEGALGEGDITLATYTGAVVGFPMVIVSLVLAFALGGVGALLVLVTRRGKLGSAIPYGPFIILGGAITQIWGAQLLAWLMR